MIKVFDTLWRYFTTWLITSIQSQTTETFVEANFVALQNVVVNINKSVIRSSLLQRNCNTTESFVSLLTCGCSRLASCWGVRPNERRMWRTWRVNDTECSVCRCCGLERWVGVKGASVMEWDEGLSRRSCWRSGATTRHWPDALAPKCIVHV